MILDGYGLNDKCEANAVCEGKTPVMDQLMSQCPFVKGNASGMAVGLPEGQMGNSEVGHLNMGAGRIVYQELTRITKEIQDGDFFKNEALLAAVKNAKENNSALHFMGLLSDGGVHSHNTHLYGLLELAKRECKELHFTNNGRPFFAIGFPNMAGGYEVRNSFFKGCIAPKDITHIRQQGEPREKCLVFEGFMDYLSFLTLRMKNCPTMPDLDRQDYVILNSTANVSKAIDVLHGYGRIHCMLDNDEAGRKAYRELERKFAGRIRDFSDNYKGHKDLNDYLRGIRQKLAVSPPPRTIVKPKKKGLGL